MKNWHKDFPNPLRMSYNSLIHKNIMTDERLNRIIEALETLAKETDTDVSVIVDQLIGHCFDEEDGWLIESTLWGEKE